MPTPLTDLQQRFAYEFATNGGNATAAAKAAGYSAKTAHEIGRQQLDKPHVLEVIRKHLMHLRARSGAVGIQTLIQMAQSDNTPGTARVSAARALCEHAGLLGPAKEVAEARKVADADDAEKVSPRQVLRLFSPESEPKSAGKAG